MNETIPAGGKPLPNDLPKIPGITLQYEIARGGMGVVYSGRQDFLDRRVAVKLLAKELGGDAFAQRFQREAKLLAGIKHQNIVSCHLAGTTDDGQSYLVMEFIDGPSLKSWIQKNGPLSPAAALRTARSVAQALAHAHSLGVIHRDVKPENILLETVTSTAIDVNFPYTPKLVDLGLARMTAQEVGAGLTSPGSVMGTPSTMSPEQFDDPDSVDFRSDVYGLGCALYEMLVGLPAFRSSRLTEIVMQKRSPNPPDPCSERGDVPAVVGALTVGLLATRREDRPSSYKDLDEQFVQVIKAIGAATGTRGAITEFGGATVPSMPQGTRPMTKPAVSAAPAQPSGPGLLRTAELDYLSAGGAAKTPTNAGAFQSGVQQPTPVAKKSRVGVIAAVAVAVLGGAAWAIFGRGAPGGGGGGGDNPRSPQVGQPPIVQSIEGPSTADLRKPFTLKATAVAGDDMAGTLSYSWVVPPQIVAHGSTSRAAVELEIQDGLPDVVFDVMLDVGDSKGRRTQRVQKVTVGACPQKSPLMAFKNNSDWRASDEKKWTDVIIGTTRISCRTEGTTQTVTGPLDDGEYWEWSGRLFSIDDDKQPFAVTMVRFEFGAEGWAIRCHRETDKNGNPWLIEVLRAKKQGEQWAYEALAADANLGWPEPEDAEDEYAGWFSVQRRGGEVSFAIGEAVQKPDGKVTIAPRKGPFTTPFTGEEANASMTLVVDKGIGRFDLQRR